VNKITVCTPCTGVILHYKINESYRYKGVQIYRVFTVYRCVEILYY
jgi:hypothetical protein